MRHTFRCYPLLAVLIAAACFPSCKRGDSDTTSSEPTAESAAAEPVDPRESGNFEPLPREVEYDEATVVLGRSLYHDPGLSVDGSISCASCHDIAAGGDDGLPSSEGVGGQFGPINSPTTLNARFHTAQFWDGRAADLHAQAMGPMTNPIEMGATQEHVVDYVRSQPWYVEKFEEAGYDEITFENVAHAIAAFEETLVTPGRFDDWLEGDDDALTDAEQRGLETFVQLGCTACHSGPALGGSLFQKMGLVRDYFEMRGGEITEVDLGRFNVTGEESDRHVFKVPTLRNVARTAPYFHDGSVEELDEAVRIMASVQLGKDIDDQQVGDVVAFLEALDGEPIDLGLPPLEIPEPTEGATETDNTAAPTEEEPGEGTTEGDE